MPLLDHFRPPLSERRPWESFQTTFASALADALNHGVLPPGFLALEHVHAGPVVEIDVATFAESLPNTGGHGTLTLPRTVWTPATAPLVMPASFPEECRVDVVTTEGGRSLVAALELVSPGNKDRESKRRLFAAKCASYLARGVGLVVLDLVTTRTANLHNELVELMRLGSDCLIPAAPHLYAAAYRPLSEAGTGRIEVWPVPLSLGQPLPTVPLSLSADCAFPWNWRPPTRTPAADAGWKK
jgi:hypothetical protein